MILKLYTVTHVVISLLAILAGLVVMVGLFTSRRFDGWTKLFLRASILTSLTGFFFPFHGITPGLVAGAISLVVLGVAIFARYARTLVRVWGKVYVVAALCALYLNVLVLIVQAFQRVPAFKEMAPSEAQLAFKIVELLALVAFVTSGVVAWIKFRIEPTASISEAKI